MPSPLQKRAARDAENPKRAAPHFPREGHISISQRDWLAAGPELRRWNYRGWNVLPGLAARWEAGQRSFSHGRNTGVIESSPRGQLRQKAEERRVGKECVSQCKSWCSPDHEKK